jgi:hypothetical protein
MLRILQCSQRQRDYHAMIDFVELFPAPIEGRLEKSFMTDC